jgi:hypothetical protein
MASSARVLPPSPRAVLAEAAARHRQAVERLEKLAAALARAREASLGARGQMEDAEAALAEAEGRERHRAVAIALGEPVPPWPSLEEHRRVFEETQATHRRARELIALLEQGQAAAAPPIHFAAGRVEAALRDLLVEEGVVERLVGAYDTYRVRAAAVAAVLRSLGLSLIGLQHQYWEQRPIPPYVSLVPEWTAVLEKLRAGEVDTAWPENP